MPARPDGEAVALDARDASITTATVTIKALQVSKKQMTQSVFRQLPEAPLVDEERIELLGMPWGHVRYFWDNMPQTWTHFLFQKDGRLFRNGFLVRQCSEFSTVNHAYPAGYHRLKTLAVTLRMKHAYVRILQGATRKDFGWDGTCIEYDMYEEIGCYGSFTPISEACDMLSARMASPHMERRDAYIEGRRSKLEAKLREKYWGDTPIPDLGDIERELLAIYDRIRDYCRRWDALMERLEAVEQLYIAC
jgi:hypothetical protein